MRLRTQKWEILRNKEEGEKISVWGHTIYFRFEKFPVCEMKKGEQPPETQTPEIYSTSEPVPPTMEPMNVNVRTDTENVETEGTDPDSPLE